jgi:hypothetical protein
VALDFLKAFGRRKSVKKKKTKRDESRWGSTGEEADSGGGRGTVWVMGVHHHLCSLPMRTGCQPPVRSF